MSDKFFELGHSAGLSGAPLPSDGYDGPYSAERHWQIVRGYESGEQKRRSPEFRAGFERGRAALAIGDADALQRAAYYGAGACGGTVGLEESGYFYAVFGGDLGAAE